MATRWEVFYPNGERFCGVGDEKPPMVRGVQAIVQDHPDVGAEIVTGCDYYVRDGQIVVPQTARWRGVDRDGLMDFLFEAGLLLWGRMIGREEYDEVMRAVGDRKAGWLPHEVKPNG